MELKIIPGRVAKIIIMYTVEEDVGAIVAGGGIAASVHLIHLNRTKTTKPKRSPIILGLGERPRDEHAALFKSAAGRAPQGVLGSARSLR